jgi:hypothetical protein
MIFFNPEIEDSIINESLSNALKNRVQPFYFYRSLMDIIITSEENDMKKGLLLNVLVPTLKDEVDYLDEMEKYFKLKYVERYTREFRTWIDLYNSKNIRITTDLTDVEKTFQAGRTKNTSSINKFITYNPKAKVSTELKDFNTIYNINFVLEMFKNNPKEKRLVTKRFDDLAGLLDRYLIDDLKHPIFEKHKEKVMIIPINKWVEFEDYKKPKTFKLINDNLLIMILNVFANRPAMINKYRDWKILLTNYNEFMLLDMALLADDLTKEEPEYDTFISYFKKFMMKCKSNVTQESTDISDDILPSNASPEVIESLVQMEVDKLVKANNIDMSSATVEEKIELEHIVRTKIKDGSLTNIDIKDIKDIKSGEIKTFTELISTKMSNKSAESVKRNMLLNEKYKGYNLKDAKGNVIEPLEDEPKPLVKQTIAANHIVPELNEISTGNLIGDYMKNYYYQHLMLILKHFATCDPAYYMIADLKEEDVSDNVNRLYKYTVQYESSDRKRKTISFVLPKLYQERYMYINASKKDITMQKFPFAITKIAPDKLQIVGIYRKIFMERYGNSISPRLNRIIKFFDGDKMTAVVSKGNNTKDNSGYLIPIEYGELSKIFHTIKIKDAEMTFNIKSAITNIKTPNDGMIIPIAIIKGEKYGYDLQREIIIDSKGKEVSGLLDFIEDNFLSEKEKEKYDALTVGNKFMYTRCKVMAYDIPTIILAASLHDDGLMGILKMSKIKYELSTTRPKIDKNLQSVIKFENMYLVYDRYPFSNSLLLEGLKEFSTEEYTFESMQDSDTYKHIYTDMFDKPNLLPALENFKYLFCDPITKLVEARRGGPTEFIPMLLHSNDLMVDNVYKVESSYEQCRIRTMEIVLAYLYQALADAYSDHRLRPETYEFSIAEDAVIKLLMKSQLVDEHPTANPGLEAENDRRIKSKGPTGLNVDESYTLDKRAFHTTATGVVTLSSPASAEISISRSLTLNTAIVDSLGFLNLKELSTMKDSDVVGVTESVNAFSIANSSPERSVMTSGQTKHMLPVADMVSPIVSHDVEKVVPYLSKDHAFVAKKDGKVAVIEDGIMILQYKDGTFDDIDLMAKPYKHSNSGKFHTNIKEPTFKAGQPFKAGEIVAYDPKSFDVDAFGDISMKIGTMTHVAFIAAGDQFEDSGLIVESFADRTKTESTVRTDVIVGTNTNIKKFLNIGDKVEVNDKMLIFEEADDPYMAMVLANMKNTHNDEADVHIGLRPVKSKYKGTIVDIQIYHSVPLEELQPSMISFIKKVSSKENSKSTLIKKYMDLKDANTIPVSSIITKPDKLNRVRGYDVGEGAVIIEYYVEYDDYGGVGDKYTIHSALKYTDNGVIPNNLAPYLEEYPDEKLDSMYSLIGLYKRMELSSIKTGLINTICIRDKKHNFIPQFGDHIEEMYKKFNKK